MLNEEFFTSLKNQCSTHFKLPPNEVMKDQDLLALAKYCPQIASIDLPIHIGDEGLEFLYAFPKLTSLSIECGFNLYRARLDC